eukprot:TRINITY_DN37220_c0_g1_i1.p1 TRINITY_DN37220_c0_g1~~TRINITY_DN37220_c0_g1_i1.p1  ORF type:complete len:525 (+),score=72.70 TRINITY_DN37220_c0_g1_i1:45-1619(+)
MNINNENRRSRVISSGGYSGYSTGSARTIGSVVGGIVGDVGVLLDAESRVGDDEEELAPLHTAAVVFNLANTTMGVGILSLAATFDYAGLVFGPVIMIACAIITYVSVQLMVRIINTNRTPSDTSRVPTMEGMAEYCLGPIGKLWVQLVLVLICLGTLVAYLVSVKSLLYEGLKQLSPHYFEDTLSDYYVNSNTVMLLSLILVGLPLSLLRRIDGLWFTSLLSVLSIIYFVVMSTIYLFRHLDEDSREPCHELVNKDHDDPFNSTPSVDAKLFPSSGADLLQAFSIISMSYICQLTVFPIMKELSKGQRGGGSDNPVRDAGAQLLTATWITMIIACFMYTCAGVTGYVTWQNITTKPSTILACYPTSEVSVVLVYFCMTLCLLFSFPLICFTCRCTVVNIMYPEGKVLSLPYHVGITIVICAPCALVAVLASSLTTVLSVVSALTSPSLCFLLPGVCYTYASKKERSFAPYGVDECNDLLRKTNEFTEEEREKLRTRVIPGYIMVGIGVFMQVACIVAAVLNFV